MEDKVLTRAKRKQQKNVARAENRGRVNERKQSQSLRLINVEARTDNQTKIIDSFYDNDVTVVHGYPGTGKTFLALYLALQELEESDKYDSILIIRSSVSSRSMGFLPGNAKEKMGEFEKPYIKEVNKLYNRDDAWGILKQKKLVEFESTAFLRGNTFDNTIIIFDEIQNCSYQELKTVITRFGQDCKMIIMGDIGQDDLSSERYNEKSGIKEMLDVLSKVPYTGYVEMDIDDIQRSGFLKNFIIAEVEYHSK